MGLHLLEREKRAFAGSDAPQPDFTGREYLLERWLRPRARVDIIESLADAGVVPTSMIDLSDGLASDLLQVCRASDCGARIYLERIPIASQTHDMAAELHSDPVVAALNGGGDYELLFTVPLDMRDAVVGMGGVDIIGHITPASTGVMLTTPDGSDIPVTAPGFTDFS
jgi:thiamine-monophosphate kinase